MNTTRLLLCLALLGCGDDGSSTAVDAGGGGADAGQAPLLEAPPDGEGLQLSMFAPIAAGEEITYCQYFVLPAGAGLDVSRFEHRYSEGSHHMLLFPTTKTAAEVAVDQDLFVCATRGDLGNRGVAYGGQTPEGDTAYPPGVAIHFESEQVVLLQAHYLNTTDAPLDAEVSVNLWYATDEITTYAGSLFYYDWAILVPPAPGTSTVKMRCVVPDDINVMFVSSHMHRRGVGYRSSLTGGDLTEPLELFTTDQWEAPDPRIFETPLQISGGQVIEYECDFQNDLPETVIEGSSAETNEMCMFLAGYYPKMSEDAELCFLAGSGPVKEGTSTCAQALTCTQDATDDVAGEACILDTCAASSQPFNDFILCSLRNGCLGGADPTGCIVANCATEYQTCQSATCD